MRAKLSMALGLALAACSIHKMVVPEIPVELPEHWTGGETQEGKSPSDWWKRFGDPRLNDYANEVLRNNFDLQAAAARIDAAAAQVRIAGADSLPQGNLGFTGGRSVQNFVGFPIPGQTGDVLTTRFNSYSLSLDISWEADLWGRLRAGEKAAVSDLQANQADYLGAQLSLMGQTCKAYFSVVESQNQVNLAQATVESFRESAACIQERYRLGLRTSLDVRLAQSELSAAEAKLNQHGELLDRVMRQFEVLLGRYPAGAIEVEPDLPLLPDPVPAGLPASLISRRPDLVAAERRLAASTARVHQAKAALYPSISLTGSTGTTSNQLSDLLDGDFSVWSVFGNVLQPIFQRGRLMAGVDLAQSNADQLLTLFMGRALDAYSEVESALAAEAFLVQREEALKAAAEQAREAVRISKQRYYSGLDNIITLLFAQRRLLEAESQLLSVRRLTLEARVDLHLALGGGFHNRGRS